MKKCTPITQRAKSSPLRADMALIQGAGMTGRGFNSFATTFTGAPEPKAANLVTKPEEDEDKNKDGENGNGENGNGENNNDENKEE
jgi:hypothetical protein